VSTIELIRRFVVMAAVAVVLVVGLTAAAMTVYSKTQADEGTPSRVRVVSVADFRTSGRTDSQAIQAAIDDAEAGETVFFPGGVYELDQPFEFKSGVNHVGDPITPAILHGQGETSLLLQHTAANPLRDTTIRGLRFDNIELRLTGDGSYTSFVNVTLADCYFSRGRHLQPWASDYVWLSRTVGVTIDGCTFLRDAGSGGRGVVLERTRLTVIKDSFFGTTRDLEPGAPDGHFSTAINLTGYDAAAADRNEDVVVDGNVWRRTANPPCPGGPGVVCEDHGLYAWGAKDLVITRNLGDGWTNTGTGGSVKLRNSDDVFITDNHFLGSGITLHTYWHTYPRNLRHVRVAGNRIDLRGDRTPGLGITYWRSNKAGTASPYCQAPGGEDDIQVAGNQFVNGGSVTVRCALGAEVCVQGNAGAALSFQVASVRRTRCEPPETWDRPLLGLHRGDLNGDGVEDFVHQVRDRTTGALYWRAHLSSGDGYRHDNWGNGSAAAADTERYGVHVADFDGDRRDDLAYVGVCDNPNTRCWRVQRSTGQGLSAPLNYGGVGRPTAETFRFGVHVGDFNGDGRADLVLRASCGNGRGHPCWLVLAARADGRFAAMDWGDGGRWHPDSDRYGLLVGDFDGDGRDDIGYRGECGKTHPCLRVQRSSGRNGFLGEEWGDGFLPEGVTAPHFGMRVGDANGDGRADLGYLSRCGDPARPQWRYHLGGPAGQFAVACSRSYLL
jgi:hypothetical protein